MVHRKAVLGDADFLELLYMSAMKGFLRIQYEAKDFEDWMMKRRSKREVSAQ